uniref:Uncharacterized protein n=1 Tax=viral metagenome TaxID=1070528 RepID=A0A6H1ZPV7_9ZZZZ
MVEKMNKVLEKLDAQGKQVWLFAILKMDELVDKWSLIFSAPWDNVQNRDLEFKNILSLVKEELDKEELYSIARVAFLKKEDHLVQELLKKNSGDKIDNETINGNIIHEGYVIASNADLNQKEDKQADVKPVE